MPPSPPVVDVHTHLFNKWEFPHRSFLKSRFERGTFMHDTGVDLFASLLELFPYPEGPEDDRGPSHDQLRDRARRARRHLGGRHFAPGEEDPCSEPHLPLAVCGLPDTVRVFTRHPLKIAEIYQERFPQVDLCIPLMMDMWRWFPPDPEDDPTHQDPPSVQQAHLAEMVRHYPGRFHPFVAFGPYRHPAHHPVVREERQRVERAIRHQGFLGVKLYPALGYRPWGNADIHPAYDEQLAWLYDWCERNAVPICTHASCGGARPTKACGPYSDPAGWEPVLQRHPRLRLCLAHFGGYWNLIEPEEVGAWTRRIVDLLERHDHVYTDVGFHVVLERENRRHYFRNLAALVEAHPTLRDRLMFGSDWHNLLPVPDTRRYYSRYRRFFEQQFDDRVQGRFFGLNALEFLGLTEGPARERLADFYRREGLFDMRQQVPTWWPPGP